MSDKMPRIHPLEWRDGVLRLVDQTRLPQEVRYLDARDYREVAEAIRRLEVRGAPLIGIAAAYGMALGARAGRLREAAAELAGARPTAVNLRWAVERVLAAAAIDPGEVFGDPAQVDQTLRSAQGDTRAFACADAPASNGRDVAEVIEAEARRIHEEQIAGDARMGELGAGLISEKATLLTICNTGSLATGGIGTALGVIKTAHRQGKGVRALACETRPLLQGARLTTWELAQEGIPHELIVDSAAAGLMARGRVDAVVVGADRIAANGDTANKVGTYGLALAAQAHGVPLYVVAPVSSIDTGTASGEQIAIEERPADEVTVLQSARIAPEGTAARNPAFDVTPAHLITAIVTERGVLRPPFGAAIAAAVAQQAVPA
ncbi:MAG: S-methyl-5-thioribose-1-phosphate isomerase [Dehalococcoidia bacterium]